MAIPAASVHRLAGDPIRNIRWNLRDAQHQHPWLTYPLMDTNAGVWGKHDGAPIAIWEPKFFVDRKGQVVIVPMESGKTTLYGMRSDALREE